MVDPLTGVANRRASTAPRDRARAIGSAWHPCALVIVDLDDFKQVNDRHGHAVGDEVLVMLADRLRDSVRSADTVARLGGEEFALLLPETDLVRGARGRPAGADGVLGQRRAAQGRREAHRDGELRRRRLPGLARRGGLAERRRQGALLGEAARQRTGSHRHARSRGGIAALTRRAARGARSRRPTASRSSCCAPRRRSSR